MTKTTALMVSLTALLTTTACGDDGGMGAQGSDTDINPSTGADATGTDATETDATETGGGELVVPETYAFESRFEAGVSSVSYGGQSFRQVLIASLKAEMNQIQTEIDGGTIFAEGEVAARLAFYYDFDGDTSSELPHLIETTPATLQRTWGDLGSGSNLVDKTAGNDADPQHQDWSSDLIGWDASDSPEDLIRDWFEACDALAVAYSSGDIPVDPQGNQIATWFVSAEGLDYQQLVQKFLLGAVNYSQGTDDYLDDASDNGLNADNTMSDDGDPYTALEHAWDEGFGYWGGARNYLDYTDDEIATNDGRPEFVDGYNDADGDDAIDLKAEINFSASVNAGKRDIGAAGLGVEGIDYSEQTMQAFLRGRAIISHADGALSDEAYAMLQEQRDIAVDGWERALAATAIHYFNDTVQDTLADPYVFADHAKHWGELKGFLLMLQFNPRAQVSDDELIAVHDLVGTAPVLPGGDVDGYVEDLIAARDMLAQAYGFDAALVGDDVGENGW